MHRRGCFLARYYGLVATRKVTFNVPGADQCGFTFVEVRNQSFAYET